jgi:hypothetical protein
MCKFQAMGFMKLSDTGMCLSTMQKNLDKNFFPLDLFLLARIQYAQDIYCSVRITTNMHRTYMKSIHNLNDIGK